MKYCTNCGAQLDDDTKSCPNCGAPVGEEKDKQDAGSASAAGGANMVGGNEAANSGNPVQQENVTAGSAAGVPENLPDYGDSTANGVKKKKKSRKPLIIILVIAALVIIACLVLAAIGGDSSADQKIVYEGIEFQVPNKWKLDENSSTDAGLYFYTNDKASGEMLYMASVPDVSSILNLFGADYVMDWVTEYIHEQTGGETVDAQKVQTAGYNTYVYDVTGASTDVNGDSVQGGYRIACILNSDKSEMILIYAYGLSAGENDQKILSDIDYILENAAATSEANSY